MERGELEINRDYQRSSVWKPNQKQELIHSILDYNPIGVLVLWRSGKNKLEVLDGQQRITTVRDFFNGLLQTEEGRKFNTLTESQQTRFEAYEIPYLLLEQNLSEEEVSTIFIRLQEGTTLSNGEKVYAFRGNFRDTFVKAFFAKENEAFFNKLDDNRFKARFLAAKLLFLELKSNYSKRVFPDLSYKEFKNINEEYKKKPLPQQVVKDYNKNIQFLGKYLYGMIKALSLEDIVAAYLLQSYFNQKKINENFQGINFKNFIINLQGDLHKITIYDLEKPSDMNKGTFDRLQQYKTYSQKGITSNSLEQRFNIMRTEWEMRMGMIKEKDQRRLFTQEQKITLYFKQKGICPICAKDIRYGDVEADHIKKHEKGGRTEIYNGRLLHHKCHETLHKQEK